MATRVDGKKRMLLLELPDRRLAEAHLRLQKQAGKWVLEDLGSKAGTFVNGERVAGSRVLEGGDRLEIGHVTLGFELLVPSDPASVDLGVHPADPALATALPEIEQELADLAAMALQPLPIMLRGESGVGKELLAKTVHRLSGRAGRFVPITCSALPAQLVEAELLGSKKGAYKGATEDRAGLLAASDQGTLFLDEVSDLPLPAQGALLRVLQESEVTPLGTTRPLKLDLRVVTATHRDLDSLSRQGRFRHDLLARLSGFTLRLAPLRERKSDLGLFIPALLERHFASRAHLIRFAHPATRAMFSHSWPHNVRELEQALRSAVTLAADGPIELRHLPEAVRRRRPSLSADDLRRKDELFGLLRDNGGNVSAAATAMGKARMQIQRWIKRFEIDVAALRR
ncbi:MAG: sigma 54-interacting transcriptional regulator [Deltaproteobacteria bacterium]|nr:sigma 54-interacting transcriptional regulator [Deltaproteobacteria bacterium]